MPAVPGPENEEGPSRPEVALFSVLAWPREGGNALGKQSSKKF
jgi:hypothetical protein